MKKSAIFSSLILLASTVPAFAGGTSSEWGVGVVYALAGLVKWLAGI